MAEKKRFVCMHCGLPIRLAARAWSRADTPRDWIHDSSGYIWCADARSLAEPKEGE